MPTYHQPLVSPGHWNLVTLPPTRKATGIDPVFVEGGGGRDGRKNEKGTGYRMLHEKGIIQMERKWPNGSERPGKEERKGKKQKKRGVRVCMCRLPSLSQELIPPPTPPSTLDLSTHKIAYGNDIHDLIQNLAHTSFVHQKARQSKAAAQHQLNRKIK